MDPQSALLEQFRTEWREGALPLLVDHTLEAGGRICPAPSLYSGGRKRAQQLLDSGFQQGQPITYKPRTAIEWVELWLASLRLSSAWLRGAPTCAEELYAPLGWLGKAEDLQGRSIWLQGDIMQPQSAAALATLLSVGAEVHVSLSRKMRPSFEALGSWPEIVVATAEILEPHGAWARDLKRVVWLPPHAEQPTVSAW